jgi:hypothetical protein
MYQRGVEVERMRVLSLIDDVRDIFRTDSGSRRALVRLKYLVKENH